MSFLKWLAGRSAGTAAISIVLFLLLFFGLIPQDGSRDGFWGMVGFRSMRSSPIFIASLIFLAICLAARAADDVIHFRSRPVLTTCIHTGVAVMLAAGLFSTGSTVRASLSLSQGDPVRTASDDRTGAAVKLPFELTLMDFDSADCSADLALTLPDGRSSKVCIKVNHPLRSGRWWVYLTDYAAVPEMAGYSCTLRCVYSPGSWIFGIALWVILLSAAAMIVFAGIGPVSALKRGEGGDAGRDIGQDTDQSAGPDACQCGDKAEECL